METLSENTRENLLDAALRLFVAHGYEGTGVQGIASSAGVTKPSLYHYFGSKSGVLEALFSERLGTFHAALTSSASECRDLEATLTTLARVTFTFARNNRDLYWLYFVLWLAPPQSDAAAIARRHHQHHFSIFEGVFQRAATAHPQIKGRAGVLAVTFLGMLNQYVSLGLSGDIDLDEEMATSAVHQYMHGIFQ